MFHRFFLQDLQDLVLVDVQLLSLYQTELYHQLEVVQALDISDLVERYQYQEYWVVLHQVVVKREEAVFLI